MKFLIDLIMYTYILKEMALIISKKPYMKIIVYILLVLFGILLACIPQYLDSGKQIYHRVKKNPSDMKYILFWHLPKVQHRRHNYGYKPPEFQPGQTMFIKQNCSNINCYITYDKKLLTHKEDYDAIVFDIENVKRINIDKIRLPRSPEQLYIFRSLEAAGKFPICNRYFDNYFNLTWTYKLSSDIPQPAFDIYNENNTIVGPRLNMSWIQKMKRNEEMNEVVRNKNKSVAWIIYKCKLKTKHLDFMNDFRNVLKLYNHTLDTYGPCGQNKCRSFVKCQQLIEKQYFFQLVLEDHITDDFVTNKIVSVMSQYIMPIVIGAGDYRNFLPPGSYINAQTFDLNKLAALVDYLMKNPEMYQYIFDWKNHYYFKDRPGRQVCQLCEKLNEKNQTTQSYTKFRHWWQADYKDVCERIRLLKIFNSDM